MLTYKKDFSFIVTDKNLQLGKFCIFQTKKIYLIIDCTSKEEGMKLLEYILDSILIEVHKDNCSVLFNIYIYIFNIKNINDGYLEYEKQRYYTELLEPNICYHFIMEDLFLGEYISFPNYYYSSITYQKYNSNLLIINSISIHQFTSHELNYVQIKLSTDSNEIKYIKHKLSIK
jgi:hypothetical protein